MAVFQHQEADDLTSPLLATLCTAFSRTLCERRALCNETLHVMLILMPLDLLWETSEGEGLV